MKKLNSFLWRIFYALGGEYIWIEPCRHDWTIAMVILPTRGLGLHTNYCIKCGGVRGGGLDSFHPEGHTELLELQNKIKHATPEDFK